MGGYFRDKKVVGLTGTIAAGKSRVRQILEHLGAFGIDVDDIVQRSMRPGGPAYEPILDRFGDVVLSVDRTIDSQLLAAAVVEAPQSIVYLDEVMIPIVHEALTLWIGASTNQLIVLDAARLFEYRLFPLCDTIWLVTAPLELRVERLQRFYGLSEEAALQRIEAEPSRVREADVIINNSGHDDNTFFQVRNRLNRFLDLPPDFPDPEADDTAAESLRKIRDMGTQRLELPPNFRNPD